MALTPKQQRFVEEYLVDLNGAQAAIRAGYSPSSAKQIAKENMTKPYLATAIQEAMDARAERTRITADKVLTEYAKLAFSDMREIARWNEHGVTWRGSGEITDEAAACIKDLAMNRETRRDKNGDEIDTVNLSLKLHDKKGALQDVAKHLGLFPGSGGGVNVNVNVNGETEVGRTAREIREIDEHIAELEAEVAQTQAGEAQS